jgi:hypothetical protein
MSRSDITIKQGKTFSRVLRWSTDVPSYAAIQNISNSAPISIICANHNIPDGWDVAIASVKGMKEVNILGDQPKLSEYKKCRVIDEDTIEIPEINSLAYKPYQGGGAVVFRTPVDIHGYIGRFIIKDKIGGTVIHSAIPVFDNGKKTITIEINATDTAAFDFSAAVYELEVESGGGIVTQLLFGVAKLEKEVAV